MQNGLSCRVLLVILLCVVPFLSGCGSRGERDDARRDALLEKYFEPEAIAGHDGKRGLGSIPLRYADIGFRGGIAIGDDLGMRLVSLLLGQGVGRQVLLSDSEVSELLVFHEYMHQAQYSDFVNAEFFRERFDRLRWDPAYAPAPVYLENDVIFEYMTQPGLAVALLYNGGLDREMIAFVIEGWARGDYPLPEYMLEVYRGTVKIDTLKRDFPHLESSANWKRGAQSTATTNTPTEGAKALAPLL